MFKCKVMAGALAFAGAATAQESELAKIREEIQQMKQSYERRIETLERRLADAEGKVDKAEPAAAPAVTRGGEGAFNPAVSLVQQGTYARTSRDPMPMRSPASCPPARTWRRRNAVLALVKPNSIFPPISTRIFAVWPSRRWRRTAVCRSRKRISRRWPCRMA